MFFSSGGGRAERRNENYLEPRLGPLPPFFRCERGGPSDLLFRVGDDTSEDFEVRQHATPSEVAHVSRLNFGKQSSANHGPHSVGANQQATFELRSVIEGCNGAIVVMYNFGHIPPGVKVLRGEGVAQEVVK